MTIPFKNLPQNIRVPLFYAEVDNSRANTAIGAQRGLIIGQMVAGNQAVPGVPVITSGPDDAARLCGMGSMVAAMVTAYRANDPMGEVWVLPLLDDPGALAASGTVTFNTSPTANGTFYLYIGGKRYALPVLTTQSFMQIAVSLAALVNADLSSEVTATSGGGTVTFTAVQRGPVGNDIDLRVNYLGTAGGEASADGLSWNIVPMSGGATAPSLTGPLANLGNQTFDFIALPYTDTASLDAIKATLNDSTGRWSYAQQLYGGAFAARAGTLGSQTTFGAGRNDQHVSVMAYADSPTPPHVWAAAITGAAAVSLRNDPGLPLQTVTLSGVRAAPLPSRFTMADRNVLLYTGLSTHTVADDGTVAIENLVTTYQKNAYGSADDSYLEVETLYTLAYVLRYMRTAITSKFARMKLAADGTRFAAGSAVVTPKILRAELVAHYRELESRGMVQKGDEFAASLIVEQNASNPNRVDVLWPGTLINQLRIFALLAQFRLS